MSAVEIQNLPETLHLLPVRDVVIFPFMVMPLAVGREKSIRALEAAMTTNRMVFVSTQKKAHTEDPSREDLFEVGVVGEILQMLKMTDGTLKILIEGLKRAKMTSFNFQADKGYVEVNIQPLMQEEEANPEIEALRREAISLFDQYVKANRRLPIDISTATTAIEDIAKLTDTIASHLQVKVNEKQELLETLSVKERLNKLIKIFNRELEILNIERRIQNRVRTQIEKTQKEYYLTEQMKAIQKELRQKDDFAKEVDEIKQQVKQAKMSKEAQEMAEKEIQRLEKMMPFSPEATVIRTYLDWLINLPWAVFTQDNFDLKKSKKVLDDEHYGLEKIKERVLEYLAVLKLVKKIKGPILCFVGPPGVGKTSIAKSIANSLGRSFVRVSLGGVRDEAEIRGHRRTYIGALPGRVIQWMRKAKSKNPVFLLDEIDKMGADWRGDPAAALLEVLDPAQNSTFVDHYLDIEFDLSNVMFITTANTLYSIPPSLIDRLEILRFSGYISDEKIRIAQQFLIPKQIKEHGLSVDKIKFSEDALVEVIENYTREAGVRNLEREIANICRKISKEMALNPSRKHFLITKASVGKYLGVPEFYRERISANAVGVATGLAWTEHGGETLTIEVAMLKGKGKYLLTGKLGEVMQESAQAAMTYVRSIADKYKIKSQFFKDKDFHIHVPEGAIPKDGPSAGTTIATALASIVTGRPVKKDVAMTGEITLSGRVLPIGGLREKLVAATRENIKTVLLPEGNKKDLSEIPKNIQRRITLIPVKTMDQVLKIALAEKAERKS